MGVQRSSAAYCTECGPPVLAQKTFAETGLRYCKPCFRAVASNTENPARCLVCCAELQADEGKTLQCSFTSACEKEIRLCEPCGQLNFTAPCLFCYAKHFRSGCVLCKRYKFQITMKPPAGRRCHECFAKSQQPAMCSEGDCALCFAPCSATNISRCTRVACVSPQSSGQICLCDFCRELCSARPDFELLCFPCWTSLHGELCFICASMPRRRHNEYYSKHLCQACAGVTRTQQCYFCSSPLNSSELAPCESELCRVADARNAAVMCATCKANYGSPLCAPCYRELLPDKCITCRRTPAQLAKMYGKYCKACYGVYTDAGKAETLRTEAETYLSNLQSYVGPTGDERALQVLLKPMPDSEPLPQYSNEAHYLSPNHCRLCLSGDEDDIPLDLPAHLQQHHGLSMDGYRRRVLENAITHGLQPVPNQLLRTRLAQYQQAFCKEQVEEGVCAACARTKRCCKLTRAQFGLTADVPAWLGWSTEQWHQHGMQWLRHMDGLLNIETYWRDYFEGPERIQQAHQGLTDATADATHDSDSAAMQERAQHWLDRVLLWSRNIRAALHEDSVVAPSPLESRWLLFRPALEEPSEEGLLECHLCNRCAQAFRALDAKEAPRPSHSAVCRARGLWAGPEPEAIRKLSWVGRRVLQLARAVVCVKTVRNPLPGMPPSIWPMYTTGNVHAFPQKANEISRALGLLPQDICCDIAIQFETANQDTIAQDRTLRVSVQELRDALWWYCTNNWEWMLATREELPQECCEMGPRLEKLLQAYGEGLPHGTSGVPDCLRKTATQVRHEISEGLGLEWVECFYFGLFFLGEHIVSL